MIEIAHLLDDFGMGGVTRALTLFEEPALSRFAHSKIVPIDAQARIAPRIEANIIVDHMALSWKRLMFLASLRARNPHCQIIHVEHSYTRSFEQANVQATARFRTMLRIAASLVDEFVCVSNAQRDWLANSVGINCDKLHVIYPWTDREELFAVPALRPIHHRPMRLLAYGRYASVKNFAELIRAMEMVPANIAQLTVFGDGPDREELSRLAAKLTHVEVLGRSDSPQEHLANCDAVIIPSRYEAFGLVATEARMAGRPILVADVDGLPEQVAECGLVAKMETAHEIAVAIRRSARLDLAELGQNGRISVQGQSDQIINGWATLIGKTADRGVHSSAPVATLPGL